MYRTTLTIGLLGLALSAAVADPNQTTLKLPHSVHLSSKNSAYPKGAQGQPTLHLSAAKKIQASQAAPAVLSNIESQGAILDLNDRVPMIAQATPVNYAQYMQQMPAQQAMPARQPAYNAAPMNHYNSQAMPNTYAQAPAPMPQMGYTAQQRPYYTESTVANTHLLQRNSALPQTGYPYRNDPKIVTQGSRDYNLHQPRTTDVPEDVDPSLYKVLVSGDEKNGYLNEAQKQYGNKSNWFNRMLKIPTGQSRY